MRIAGSLLKKLWEASLDADDGAKTTKFGDWSRLLQSKRWFFDGLFVARQRTNSTPDEEILRIPPRFRQAAGFALLQEATADRDISTGLAGKTCRR